ncbi:MAG TPA: hypothetical protein VFB66_27705 [Tepidisphaeraceae bacterium]|nr:hypothetical protein [Tepidisphaeraceae bacterium]
MPFRTRFVVAAFAAAFLASQAAAQLVQVPIRYNADVIREVGGTTTGGGMDPDTFRLENGGVITVPGGRTFVTQSEAAAHDPIDPRGLPDNGLLQVPGGTIQLGPYNDNNAMRFGDFGVNSQSFPSRPFAPSRSPPYQGAITRLSSRTTLR